MKMILLLWMAVMMIGCANIHTGEIASEVDERGNKVFSNSPDEKQNLVISASERVTHSSTYFAILDFTFQNNSNRWITAKDIAINFSDKILNREVKIVVGNDLNFWQEGITNLKAVKDYNKRLFLSSMFAIGVGIAGASNSLDAKKLGGMTMSMGAIGLAVEEYQDTMNSVERSMLVPSTHLLSGRVIVPPGLFLRRWLLIYTKYPDLIPFANKIQLSLNISGVGKKTYNVVFRGERNVVLNSNWQKGFVTEELQMCMASKGCWPSSCAMESGQSKSRCLRHARQCAESCAPGVRELVFKHDPKKSLR